MVVLRLESCDRMNSVDNNERMIWVGTGQVEYLCVDCIAIVVPVLCIGAADSGVD